MGNIRKHLQAELVTKYNNVHKTKKQLGTLSYSFTAGDLDIVARYAIMHIFQLPGSDVEIWRHNKLGQLKITIGASGWLAEAVTNLAGLSCNHPMLKYPGVYDRIPRGFN